MGKLGWNSGYIGSDQRTTASGSVGYSKYFLERVNGRFNPVLNYIGLLDIYPGAAAAYSLRKLSTTFNGSAIRVRRSSDNAEQDIGFDSVGNLNTAGLALFCGPSDGYVTTWYDQSGNLRNITQTAASNQPQIVSNGSILTQSGTSITRPILRFDGINDNFTGNSFQTTNIYSWFSVLKLSKTSSGVLFQNGTTNGFGFDVSNAGYFSPYGRNVGNTNIEPNNTNYNLLTTIRLSTSSLNFWRNSINRYNSTTVSFNQPITGTFYLGVLDNGNLYYGGDLTEIIFYITDQSLNQTSIESNINTYYSVY